MKTAVVRDSRYMDHDMGPFHVESPERIKAIYNMLDGELPHSLSVIEPRQAEEEEILAVHTRPYYERVRQTAGIERVILDPDTSTSAKSFYVALLAAGGVLTALDRIMEGEIQNGFALVRPPGHHAEASQAMGFCLFNNVAIGAEHLLRKHNLQRILILDWDLHHGNGTQHSFQDRSDILYISTHQFPHYPGTGHYSETGEDAGEGFTVNFPLLSGKTDEDYLHIFENYVSPICDQYDPDFILISAGFDIYIDDPLGGMNITAQGFGALTRSLMDSAGKHCNHRLLAVLEGGYNLEGLSQGIKQVLLQMNGEAGKQDIESRASSRLEQELEPMRPVFQEYWKL